MVYLKLEVLIKKQKNLSKLFLIKRIFQNIDLVKEEREKEEDDKQSEKKKNRENYTGHVMFKAPNTLYGTTNQQHKQK